MKAPQAALIAYVEKYEYCVSPAFVSVLVKWTWDVWCAVYISIRSVCLCTADCWTQCEKSSKYQALISHATVLAEDDMPPFTLQTRALKCFPHIFSVCANLSVCIAIFVCWMHGMWGYPYGVDASQKLAGQNGSRDVGSFRRCNKYEV